MDHETREEWLGRMRRELAAGVREVEAKWNGAQVCAVVLDWGAETAWDHCFDWEAAESYAGAEGRRVVVVKADGAMTRDRLQRIVDQSRDLYIDCFGEPEERL